VVGRQTADIAHTLQLKDVATATTFLQRAQCEARNARIASAVLATAIPSVCLSVCPSICPSHNGIVSKRRPVARCSLHRWIAKYV